jgi:hypothetical protein
VRSPHFGNIYFEPYRTYILPYRPETDEKIKDLLRTRALKYLKQQDVSRYTWLATSSDFEENIGKRDDRYGNEIYELSWVGGAGCKLKRENTAQEGRWWNLKADERCKLVDRVTIYFSNPSLDPWRLEYTSVSGGGNSDCDSIKLAK